MSWSQQSISPTSWPCTSNESLLDLYFDSLFNHPYRCTVRSSLDQHQTYPLTREVVDVGDALAKKGVAGILGLLMGDSAPINPWVAILWERWSSLIKPWPTESPTVLSVHELNKECVSSPWHKLSQEDILHLLDQLLVLPGLPQAIRCRNKDCEAQHHMGQAFLSCIKVENRLETEFNHFLHPGMTWAFVHCILRSCNMFTLFLASCPLLWSPWIDEGWLLPSCMGLCGGEVQLHEMLGRFDMGVAGHTRFVKHWHYYSNWLCLVNRSPLQPSLTLAPMGQKRWHLMSSS